MCVPTLPSTHREGDFTDELIDGLDKALELYSAVDLTVDSTGAAVVNASPFSAIIALAKDEVPTPVAERRPARVSGRQIQYEAATTANDQTPSATVTAAPAQNAAAPAPTTAAPAPTAAGAAARAPIRVRGRPVGSTKKRKNEDEADQPAKKTADKRMENRINSLVKQLEVKDAGMLCLSDIN